MTKTADPTIERAMLASLFRQQREVNANIRSMCEPLAREAIGTSIDGSYTSWSVSPIFVAGSLLTGVIIHEHRHDDRGPSTTVNHTIEIEAHF